LSHPAGVRHLFEAWRLVGARTQLQAAGVQFSPNTLGSKPWLAGAHEASSWDYAF